MVGRATKGGSHLLESLIADEPATWSRLSAGARRATSGLDRARREELGAVLYPDLFSEYDARYLSRFLHEHGSLSPEFLAAERSWACDEELHYRGFRAVYAALFGRTEADVDAEMAQREAGVSFAPLAHLFEDEFTIACLLAYDELATVRAYRANRATYAALGPEVALFARRVTADEGRHYRNFFRLIRDRHADRIPEVDAVLARIRACEGVPYGRTFVLDHDDDVWTEEIFDESAAALRRHLHV